jgi:hypothetical protein
MRALLIKPKTVGRYKVATNMEASAVVPTQNVTHKHNSGKLSLARDYASGDSAYQPRAADQ